MEAKGQLFTPIHASEQRRQNPNQQFQYDYVLAQEPPLLARVWRLSFLCRGFVDLYFCGFG